MIKHIRIQNYRSIRDVAVDLDPLTVLIGRSGTGKSNFVRAIRLLRDVLIHRGQLESPHRNGGGGFPLSNLQNIFPSPGEAKSLNYRVVLSIPQFQDALEYSVAFVGPAPGPAHITVAEERLVSGNVVFHQMGGKWLVAPAVTPSLPAGQLILGSLTGVRPATIAYAALTSGVGCYDFPGSVLQRPLGTDPTASGFTDGGESFLPTALGIINNLQQLGDWPALSNALRAVNRAVKAVDLHAPERNRLDVIHTLGDKLLSLDAAQESEGFRRFLAHLLALYQSPPKQTLIFEHPENGIHPGAMTALFEEFEGYVRGGRGQIILTTHSPQLLDHFEADTIRVVDIQDQETRIGPLAPEQRESVIDHLLHPGELLTVDPARLPGQLDEVPG